MSYLIYQGCDIRGRENIEFGEGCVVQTGTWLEVQRKGKLVIRKGANIGRRSVIGVGGLVEIGENVLIGPSVYIADVSHRYEDVTVPIAHQGIVTGKPLRIGAGAWLGTHSAVMASVGKGSVIGAGSIVTHDIPDFCVAVGAPAKVVKKYNFKTRKWVSTKNWLNTLANLFRW